METAVFLLFALLAVASALVVVTHRNPVYSTMSLVVTLFSLAVLFVLLGAPFIATLQVLVYTGAILVLFLFVLMLLNVGREEPTSAQALQRWGALVGGALFVLGVGIAGWGAYAGRETGPAGEELTSLKAFATGLFGRYLLAFEVVGLLLLVAVIAATVLARRLDEPRPLAEGAGGATEEEA